MHKDFGFVGTIPGAILGLAHKVLQLALQPEHSTEVEANPGLYWECGDYTLCAAPMDFLIDLGIEDFLILRPSPPRGKPPKEPPKLLPISGKEGIFRLESALILQNTTLDHKKKPWWLLPFSMVWEAQPAFFQWLWNWFENNFKMNREIFVS